MQSTKRNVDRVSKSDFECEAFVYRLLLLQILSLADAGWLEDIVLSFGTAADFPPNNHTIQNLPKQDPHLVLLNLILFLCLRR